ncbi:2TM domain-containing protein [Polaribacter sp. PL03]|uniref:2TM domain-containing protein n=1 Tax=Polaribacter sp. PL03 TaxID=3088353 RepID=UPI0029CE8F56|nr:2TM domain-containing protein [Polaribacter sp. PL03]MDX6746198.1 2TM domain-containing protein [Polaribacter sp. PL03]
MEINRTQQQRFILAKNRVEKISKFYKHLATYIVVNTFLSAIFIFGDVNEGDTFKEALFNYNNFRIWFFWGIGIAFQAFNTFGFNILMSEDWEDKKIQKYMDQENKRR